MLLLTGEYEHTLDDKGRLFISNKLRGLIDVEEYGRDFYLVPGANGILSLYPEKCFERIAARIASGAGAADEAVAFERMNFGLASRVELDRQGRMLLGEKTRRRARLGGELTLVGVGDHIEIWNTGSWDEYVEEHQGSFQQRVMQARQEAMKKTAEVQAD